MVDDVVADGEVMASEAEVVDTGECVGGFGSRDSGMGEDFREAVAGRTRNLGRRIRTNRR